MADSWEDYAEDQPIAVAEGAFNEAQEDDDILDSWEDALEDDSPKNVGPLKKKKPLAQIIEERKAAQLEKQKQLQEKLRQQQELENESPAERKRRMEILSKESDMQNTLDLFGATSISTDGDAKPAALDLENIENPRSKQDFDKISNTIVAKIKSLEAKNSLLVPFYEKLFHDLASDLEFEDIRKLSSKLSTLANEKQRAEKEKRMGKKGTKKAQIKVLHNELDDDAVLDDSLAEYDDFM